MIDPRISKLPKWAQAEFEREAQKASLAWPTESRPVRDYYCDDGHWHPECPEVGAVLYSPSHDGARRIIIAKGGYIDGGDWGFGSRGSGPYFESQADALLYAWWKACEKAASNLYRMRKAYSEASQ